MPRSGRPGSIRGEAARRGVSEYQIRKEREIARAAGSGQPPDLARAAGKGSSQRRRELASLNRLLQQTYPKGSPTYNQVWKDTRKSYDKYGYTLTREILVLQGLNTAYYLRGRQTQLEFSWNIAKGLQSQYADVPASLYWYHGPLG